MLSPATRNLLKTAVAALTEKQAITPMPGGQMPSPADAMGGMPPSGDPSMMGGMPGQPPPDAGGGAPPMDPAMMGMPPPPGGAPMDPSMMGAPPPGGDPGMPPGGDPGAPPPGEAPPGEQANDPNVDYDNDGKPDVMVPLGPITQHTVSVIEAVKGKRTADAPPPEAKPAPGAGGPAGSLGGAPAAEGGPGALALGGMPKMGRAKADTAIAGVAAAINRVRSVK